MGDRPDVCTFKAEMKEWDKGGRAQAGILRKAARL